MSKLRVFEVGPRDGLQSESARLSLADRKQLVELLVQAGLRDIEVGSFVRADRIPQLAESDKLLKILPRQKGLRYWAFVPNEVGLRQALAAGIDGASFFVGVSDTFCHKNVNRSQAEILAELARIVPVARKAKILSRVYVSTLVYCPYEGNIDPKRVANLVGRLAKLGIQEIVLSDTTGHANPRSLQKVLDLVLKKVPAKQLALHLHDTRGLGLTNVYVGMENGIQTFDSSTGGMGGCPYAPGAAGNLATEDLVNMLAGMGKLPGVDLGRIAKASHFAETKLGKKLPSKVLKTLEVA